MLFINFTLTGNCKRDFNTEIRYDIASAKADGAELIEFNIPSIDDTDEISRLSFCISKVLNAIKREGFIQFFVKTDDLKSGSAETYYILNKYSNYITNDLNQLRFYVKLL